MAGETLHALQAQEQLNSSNSPVMWPDQSSFGDLDPLALSSTPSWLEEVQKDDMQMLVELGSLTHSQLMEKVKALQTFAYQLGTEEAKQTSRGRCLQVFDSHSRRTQSRHGTPMDPNNYTSPST